MSNQNWKYWNLLDHVISNGPIKEYTGIGSRQQTKYNFRILVRIGMLMAYRGYRLRSGAAHGSDEAFELGVRLWLKCIRDARPDYFKNDGFADLYFHSHRDIFIPKNGFRGRTSKEPGVSATKENDPKTREMTNQYHPYAHKLGSYVASMMDRNANQVLGYHVDTPTSGIICHTPDGADGVKVNIGNKTGGTGQAIRIANGYDIAVSNIGQQAVREDWLKSLEKFDSILMENLNISSKLVVDGYLDRYDGFKNVIEGDLVKTINETDSLDAMIHGCNCFNTMGSGIAKAVKETFPGAYEADCQTKSGDKNKLGTYTSFNTNNLSGKPVTIINGYTQYKYGKITEDMQEPFVDYEKLRKLFQQINKDFAGKNIGIPKIGAGLAGGEWFVVARLIQESARNVNITLFKL